MDFKSMWEDLASEAGINEADSDVYVLLERLKEITPLELAEALCILESHKNFSEASQIFSSTISDSTKLYLSRILKKEMETIYLELAKHLRNKSHGSVNLLNTVFDFLAKTMKVLVRVPHLVSLN